LENKELRNNISIVVQNVIDDTDIDANNSYAIDIGLLCEKITDYIEMEIAQREPASSTGKELIDYLAIAQTADLHQLAFEYSCNEQWTLLALVVVELAKRANQDSAITKSYGEKHCADRNDTKGISEVPDGSQTKKSNAGSRGTKHPQLS
jgi:hypothetical protein